MHLTVKGKQLDVGDALRTHVGDTLNAIVVKYFDRPIEATVVMSKDAHLYKADISVHVGRGIMLQSNAEADLPYPAFDTAVEKIAKRLRRHKRRLKDRHQRAEGAAEVEAHPANQYVLQDRHDDHHPDELQPDGHDGVDGADGHGHGANGEGQPVIIAEMTTAIQTLTVGEAVMRLDLAELSALMFRNRAHGGLNMVYRRQDGHIGWIDPKDIQGAGA